MNAYFNSINANLATRVKNPNPELGSVGFTKVLDLAKFFLAINLIPIPELPLLILSMILFLLTSTRSFTETFIPVVLSIEISGVAIWLKSWIKR